MWSELFALVRDGQKMREYLLVLSYVIAPGTMYSPATQNDIKYTPDSGTRIICRTANNCLQSLNTANIMSIRVCLETH